MPASGGVDQLETSLVTFPDEGLVPRCSLDDSGTSCLVPHPCLVSPVQRYGDQLGQLNEGLDGAWASRRARLDNHEGGTCSDQISELQLGEDLGNTTPARTLQPGRKRPRIFLTRECVNRCLQGSQSGEDGSPVGYGWHDSGTAQSSTDTHQFHVRTYVVYDSFAVCSTHCVHLAWRASVIISVCSPPRPAMVVRSRLVPLPPYFAGGRRAFCYSLRGAP